MAAVSGVPLLYELGNAQAPYKSITDFKFSPETLKHLESFGHDQLTCLDCAVGANIAIGNDCVILAEVDNNKAMERRVMAYLLPILQDLTCKPWERPSGKVTYWGGCQVLIVSSSKSSGRQIEKVVQFLRDCVRRSSGLSSKIEVEYSDDLNVIYKKRPTIVITDMESLQIMRGTGTASFLFRSLKYLVFEEQELYSEQNLKEIPEVIAIAEQHHEKYRMSPLTTVFATNQWTSNMETMFTDIRFGKKRNIVAFFYQMSELVKFANVNWNLTLATGEEDDDARFRQLNDILSNGFSASHSKVAICCSTKEKADFIRYICVGMKINARIAGFPESAADMGFPPGAPEVTIIPDQSMNSGKDVTNEFTYLLGFDGDIMKQIRCLTDSFPRLNSDTNQIEKKDVIANFLMTGKEANFLSYYKFAKGLDNVSISDELEKIGGAMVSQELNGMPLCSGIRLYGYCNNWTGSRCQFRHDFNERDVQVESVIPCLGKIEFKVIRCTSPSEYTCLLLNFRISSSDPVQRSFDQEREEYVEALNKLAKEKKLKTPPKYENGATYAVYDAHLKSYKVATLMLRACDSENSKFVHFDDLVTGQRFALTIAKNVFLLPAGLAHLKPPPPLVTVIFCGVRPRGSREMEYSSKEIRFAQNLTRDRTYKAYVGLSVGNTIWARAILYSRSNEGSKNDGCLRTLMLAKEIVSLNPFHLGKLLDLVRKLGVVYPDHMALCRYENASSDLYHNYGDVVQWRHLELSTVDSVKLTDIKATYVYDPWYFYGVCSEFEQLLNRLEGELTKWASDHNVYERYNVSENKFLEETLKVGSIVAVKIKNEDNDGFSWKRGLVTDIQGIDVSSVTFEIFLVDFGETLDEVSKEEIVPILKKFVNVLPFQAITLSLNHIKPRGEGISLWDQAAKETFWRIMIPDGYNTYFKAIATQDVSDDHSECRSYHVLGMYRDQEIGEMMMSKNVAVQRTNIKEWMRGVSRATNQAVLNLVENEDEDSSEEQFFDALENLDDFDVNLETNRNYDPHPMEESIKQLEEKLKDIKIQRKTRFSTGNASKKPINAPKGIFTTTCVNRALRMSPPVKSILSKKRSSKSKNRKNKKSSPIQEQAKSSTMSAQHPQMKTPEVLWHQTRSHMILTVKVTDVQEGEYCITIENLSFVSLHILKPQESYGFQIQLVGKVTGWTVQLSGQQLTIHLEKLNPTEEGWPRLLWDKTTRFRWLKFNKDYIKEGDDAKGNLDYGGSAVVPMYGVGTVDHYEYGEDNDENLNEIEEDRFFQVPSSSKVNRSDSFAIMIDDDDDDV